MTQYFMFIFLLMNSISFLFMNHPLSMGLMLMIQTIMISLFTGMFTHTFWFSYSLFLIFMGGMLILFMYMTSLASNETFNFMMNKTTIIFWILILLMIFMIFILFDINSINLEMKKINNDKETIIYLKTLMEKNSLMLNKLFNFPMNLTTILLVFYLFLTLIMSVKITNIFKGPLRMK